MSSVSKEINDILKTLKGEETDNVCGSSNRAKACYNIQQAIKGNSDFKNITNGSNAKGVNEIAKYVLENGVGSTSKLFKIATMTGKSSYVDKDNKELNEWTAGNRLSSVGSGGVNFVNSDGLFSGQMKDLELRSIGTKADTINSDGTITRNINKLILTGDEAGWKLQTTNTNTLVFMLEKAYGSYKGDEGAIMCDKFKPNVDGDAEKIKCLYQTGSVYIAILKTKAADLDAFKAWLKKNNVTLYYGLLNSVTEKINDILLCDNEVSIANGLNTTFTVEETTYKNDYNSILASRLKNAQKGFKAYDDKLGEKADSYISTNGLKIFSTSGFINDLANNTVISDIKFFGESMYKDTSNNYSKDRTDGCSLVCAGSENSNSISVNIKNGTGTTVKTVTIPFKLNGVNKIKDEVSKGKLIRRIGELTLNGTSFNSTNTSIGSSTTTVTLLTNSIKEGIGYYDIMCDKYSCNINSNANVEFFYSGASKAIKLIFKNSYLTSLVADDESYTGKSNIDILNYVHGKDNAHILYPLATEVTTSESTLNNLINTLTISGDVVVDSGDIDIEMKFSYPATKEDIKKFLVNKNCVKMNGQLQRSGLNVVNSKGKITQLVGVGSHHFMQYSNVMNKANIATLKAMGCNVFRPTMYLGDRVFSKSNFKMATGYLNSKKETLEKLRELINACIDLDMYVIVDWHIYAPDGGILVNKDDAIEFFNIISTEYANCPNIIYELANEPYADTTTCSWTNVKSFIDEVGAVIIKNSPNALIISGFHYSTTNDVASKPITSIKNFFYSPHSYTGEGNYSIISEAFNTGLPIFVSEWGNAQSSGDGARNDTTSNDLINFLNKCNISWLIWKLTYQDMTCSMLKFSKDAYEGLYENGGWIDYLSDYGKYYEDKLIPNN